MVHQVLKIHWPPPPHLPPPHKSHPGEAAVAQQCQVKHSRHFTSRQHHVCRIQSLLTSSSDTLIFPSKDLILLDLMAGAVKFLLPCRSPFQLQLCEAATAQFSPFWEQEKKVASSSLVSVVLWSSVCCLTLWSTRTEMQKKSSLPRESRKRAYKNTLGLRKQGMPCVWLESFSLARLFPVEVKGVFGCTKKIDLDWRYRQM